MRPIAAEWIAKAEADFATLQRECRARTRPNYDGACFHAQQCAEKYLKAVLSEFDVAFARTHDLVVLLEAALPQNPLWEVFREDMAFLSDFAVAYRYPGDSAHKQDALEARRRCGRFRDAARTSFGLKKETVRRRALRRTSHRKRSK